MNRDRRIGWNRQSELTGLCSQEPYDISARLVVGSPDQSWLAMVVSEHRTEQKKLLRAVCLSCQVWRVLEIL